MIGVAERLGFLALFGVVVLGASLVLTTLAERLRSASLDRPIESRHD